MRNQDGRLVTAGQVEALAAWQPHATTSSEIEFTPARVLMQDFTGVPCVVDLVAMRDAMTAFGGDPQQINPLIPTDLVIDHSVIADVFGRADAFAVNAGLGGLAENRECRGKPLGGDLVGMWSARRGDFRVIYRLDHDTRTLDVRNVAARPDADRPQ